MLSAPSLTWYFMEFAHALLLLLLIVLLLLLLLLLLLYLYNSTESEPLICLHISFMLFVLWHSLNQSFSHKKRRKTEEEIK